MQNFFNKPSLLYFFFLSRLFIAFSLLAFPNIVLIQLSIVFQDQIILQLAQNLDTTFPFEIVRI